MVQAAHGATRSSPVVRAWYERPQRRKRPAVARTALARKLLICAWALLRHGVALEESVFAMVLGKLRQLVSSLCLVNQRTMISPFRKNVWPQFTFAGFDSQPQCSGQNQTSDRARDLIVNQVLRVGI